MNHWFLPIGSVVRLRDIDAKVMIIGYYPVRDGKLQDYLCTYWPLGLFWSRDVAVIDHDQIEEVCWRGFSDEAGERAIEMVEKTYLALAQAGKEAENPEEKIDVDMK